MTSSPKRSRARRVLGVLGSLVGVTVTFVVASASAALVHLDLPATRRLVATQVNAILADTLAGKVHIEHIGGLGLGGIDGGRVRVYDPEGVQVLQVDGVRVRLGALAAARSALLDDGPIRIDVGSVSIGNVDANLDADASGELRLAKAFASQAPGAPASPNEPPGRGVRVSAPALRLGHAWVHGTPPGAPLLDADLYDLAARADVDSTVTAGKEGALVRAELDRVRLVTRALPRGADPRGTIGGRFTMPAQNGHGVDVQAVFDGEIGGVPTTAEARMVDRRIDARVDASDPTGTRANALVTELAVREPVALHAEAHGDLPEIEGVAALRLGQATVDANAVLEASTKTHVKAVVTARNVDAAAIVEGAPRTNVGLDASGEVAIDEGGVFGEASLDTLPGTVDRQAIPRIEVRGRFAGTSAQVRARIHEATMPTEIALDLAPRTDGKEGQVVSAAVRSNIPDLHHVPEVGTKVGGSADLDASARLVLPEKRIEDAQASVVLSKLSAEQVRLGHLEVKARASGSVDRPVIDGAVHGCELVTGALSFAVVDAGARIELAEKVVTVRDAKARATRAANQSIEVHTRMVRVSGPELRVDGAEILGVGEPIRADVTKDAREIRGQIDAPRIDLPLAARLAGKEDIGIERGSFGIRGEGVLRRGVARGKVHAEVADLSMHAVKGARAVVDGAIDDREVDLAIGADLGGAGKLELRTENARLDGRVDDARSWKRASGRVRLAGRVDMDRAAGLLPDNALPFADLRGTLSVQGSVGRDGPEVPPEVQLHAHTNGLAAAGRSRPAGKIDGVEIEAPPTWRTTDVDLGFDLRTDGISGFTGVAFRATDRRGVVVAFDAKALVPFDAIVADPGSARAHLVEAPLSVRMEIPPRRVDQLPAIAQIKNVRGAVEAQLDASGTVLEPRIHLLARSRGIHTAVMPADVAADSDVELHYDGEQADLIAKVSSHGRELLDATAHLDARARDLIASGAKRPPKWTAAAHARLAAFPLETIPQLADRRIRGRLSGELTLADLHKDARLTGEMDLEGLAIGKAEYPKGKISVDTTGGKLAAKVRLDQTDGFVDASAATGLAWGDAIAPSLDRGQPIEATLAASAFRAAALQPFVESSLPVLDGRIDANAKVRIVPGQPGAELDGKLVFRDGLVQVAALGEELRAVRATATFAPDGTVHITDVAARGTQGEVRADGAVKLDGMRIEDATANVRIPDRRPLAVAVQGQPIGEVSGTIRLKATQSKDARNTLVVVEVPRARVELPQVTKSGIQALERKENIRVGVYRDSEKFVMLPLDEEDLHAKKEEEAEPSRLDVDVRLGKVSIARGNQLRVNLSGNPQIAMENGESALTGQVNVLSGWVDVQGKKFDLEKGTVTFNGETPPDPVVVATAGWTAADGSRIYADFVGPVTTGKVTLRSEPPRPKNEILAIVLFGTADGANPQPAPPGRQSDGTTKAAVGLGGGFVAQGLTEALDDLAGIQATARIDTTRSNNPRPEVEFQISPKVSLSFAHVLGTPPITEPDKNLASMEYRFHRNWSLETTVGDRGTALLDAIWQKRY